MVATQRFVIFTPNPRGNDPIWRSYFSIGLVETTNSKTWWNKSVFVKSLICKKIWGFVFNPYSWRSLYDYVVVEYGIFFSGNQICYQTCCMLGVGCNWQFGRCFGISRPWALSQISCKEKGYSKCRGPLKWKSNVSLKSEKKTANKKCHSFPSVILVKLPQRAGVFV